MPVKNRSKGSQGTHKAPKLPLQSKLSPRHAHGLAALYMILAVMTALGSQGHEQFMLFAAPATFLGYLLATRTLAVTERAVTITNALRQVSIPIGHLTGQTGLCERARKYAISTAYGEFPVGCLNDAPGPWGGEEGCVKAALKEARKRGLSWEAEPPARWRVRELHALDWVVLATSAAATLSIGTALTGV